VAIIEQYYGAVWACSKIGNIAVTLPILQNNIAARLQQSSVL